MLTSIQYRILMLAVILFASVASIHAQSWVPGHTHPKFDNVIAADQVNTYRPAHGYVWGNSDGQIGPVRWRPGHKHPKFAHVLAAEKEGYFKPEPGYEWDIPGQLGPVHPIAGQVSKDNVLMERRTVIGVSHEVKKLLKAYPQGRHYHKNLTELIIEERQVPKGCGVRAAKFFRDEILSTFRVPARDSCFISDEKVECRTEYLPGYSKVYLSLNYQWRPDQIDFTLKIQQQGIWGVKQKQLSQEHVTWFESLFDCLVSVTECYEQLPYCTRRTFQNNE